MASAQSKQASSLTAEQVSGLRGLNGQLTQLLGQMDPQGVADRAKQGRMSAGQQAKPHTVPQHVQRSTMAPRVVLLAALERQMGRGSVAAASTSTAMKAGSSYSKPWPADFELSMADSMPCYVPVCQLNSEGITMFAEVCRSSAARGVVMPGCPRADAPLAQWKAWVQSRAAPASTGTTHVPFAMLSTGAQLHMLKVFWEFKQLDAQAVADRAKQGEMNAEPAAAGTSTATKAGNSLPKPPSWPADFELSMANAKLRNVPVSELNGEGITMFATSCRSSAAWGFAIPGLHACPRADRRLGQWKTWVQSKAGPATTGDTYVPFAMLSTSAQQRMLKGFWEVKQREASQGQTAAAGTSTATQAGPPSSEPWPAGFILSLANEKLP